MGLQSAFRAFDLRKTIKRSQAPCIDDVEKRKTGTAERFFLTSKRFR